jgi:raffinose/stachyose/melibiose transport system substrate-binding protein
MLAGGNSGTMGNIDADGAQFGLSFYPYPGGTSPDQTMSYLHLAALVSINAHSSAQNQAAAQMFVDFLARPKQDALYARVNGALTQDEFLEGQMPAFMSSFVPIFANHDYVIEPDSYWWNANVLLALQTDAVGLITGQLSVDDVLNAMDAAWKQGPS